MVLRSATTATAGLVIFGSPIAALAVPIGSVTTSPFGSAPVLALPLLLLLAIVLAGITIFRLRRRGAAPVAIVAVGAALLVMAGVTYATVPIIVLSDVACNARVTNSYTPTTLTEVTNHCINPVKIVDITFSCNALPDTVTGEIPSLCEIGQTLNPGSTCRLPECA